MKNRLFPNRIFIALYFTGIFICYNPVTATAQKNFPIDEFLQEFFIGETVYAQDKNEMQLTTRPAYWNNREMKQMIIPLQFEYGFTDRFQAEVVIPYYFTYPKTGQNETALGNTEIGVLYNILKNNDPFAASLALSIEVPIAKRRKAGNDTKAEWEPALIIAKQIGNVQIHASVIGEFSKNESAINYNLGAIVPFKSWRFTLEVNTKDDDKKIFYLSPGFVWKGLDDFEFGAGFSRSITKGTAEQGIILMITHEFFISKRTHR